MTIRNLILLAGFSAFLIGCVIQPRPYPPASYSDDYYDYYDTPSYEGYYYVRIVFINHIPYYVYDDREIRPIPPRLREHFMHYRYQDLHRPPVFSRDREIRDGYPLWRIVYLDGIPYDVDDNRTARPLPNRLHPNFRFVPPNEGNSHGIEGRPPRPNDFNRDDDHRGPGNPPVIITPNRGGDQQPGNGHNQGQMNPPVFGGNRANSQNGNSPSDGRFNDQSTPPTSVAPGNAGNGNSQHTQPFTPPMREEHVSPVPVQRDNVKQQHIDRAEEARARNAERQNERQAERDARKSRKEKSREDRNSDQGDDNRPDDSNGKKDNQRGFR